MAKSYKFTAADVPSLRRGKGIYAEIVADFIAQGTQSMQVTVEGMKSATLRAGLRRSLGGEEAEGVRLAQRGEETYLVRANRP